MIAVIVPTLNAERTLGEALGALTRAAIDGLVREVIVADGGSMDATLEIADDAGAEMVTAAGADRGALLAAGMAAARSPWILTLRQDSHVLPGWEAVVARHLETAPNKAAWFPIEPVGLLARLAGPGDGASLLAPRRLIEAKGGYAHGHAEAKLAARLGRGAVVRLAVPVLSPADRAGPGAR